MFFIKFLRVKKESIKVNYFFNYNIAEEVFLRHFKIRRVIIYQIIPSLTTRWVINLIRSKVNSNRFDFAKTFGFKILSRSPRNSIKQIMLNYTKKRRRHVTVWVKPRKIDFFSWNSSRFESRFVNFSEPFSINIKNTKET